MRARPILLLHEYQSARTRLDDDVVAVTSLLRSRGIDFAYAHLPRDAEMATIVAEGVRACDPVALDVFRRSLTLSSVDPDAYAALVICDHIENLALLGADADFGKIVSAFIATDRPIVAIGHVAGALAGVCGSDGRSILADRRVTFATQSEDAAAQRASPSDDIERAITRAGALAINEEPGDEHVSVDAYLITAQNVRSSTTAMRTFLAFLDPVSQSRKRAS